jgi:hypothetical protein
MRRLVVSRRIAVGTTPRTDHRTRRAVRFATGRLVSATFHFAPRCFVPRIVWVEACTLVQPPAVCRDGVLSQIARHLPAEQKDQALALLLHVFSSAMRRASSPYQDELALVEDIGLCMDSARRTVWLAQLRTQYKTKRNFVRDLPDR